MKQILLIVFLMVGQGVNCDLACAQTLDDEIEGALGEYESDTMYNTVPLPPPISDEDDSPTTKRMNNVLQGIYFNQQYNNQVNEQNANQEYIRNMRNIQGRKARGYYDE
jgi:hypothetical protein